MEQNILCLCSGHSCRSQIAESWGRVLKADSYNFCCSGIVKYDLNPNAAKVKQEIGFDMGQPHSKSVEELLPTKIDFLINIYC